MKKNRNRDKKIGNIVKCKINFNQPRIGICLNIDLEYMKIYKDNIGFWTVYRVYWFDKKRKESYHENNFELLSVFLKK